MWNKLRQEATQPKQEVIDLKEEIKDVSVNIAEIDTKVETAIEAKLVEGLESRFEGKVQNLKEGEEESGNRKEKGKSYLSWSKGDA